MQIVGYIDTNKDHLHGQNESPHFMRILSVADPSGCAVWGVGLRALAGWDCGFESRRGHGCPCLVGVVCCQAERYVLRADHSSRVVLPSVVCLSAIDELHRGGLGLLEVVEPLEKKMMSVGL